MLEYDIAGLEAGKRVEKASDQRPCPVPDLPFDPGIRRHHGSPVSERHDKGEDVRNGLLRERDRQPEKRASPQIKRHAPAHTASQIYIGIPEKAAASDGPVRKDIKRHLLYIVITVVEEDPLVIYQKGKDRCNIQQRPSQKQQYVMRYSRTVLYQVEFLCFQFSLFLISSIPNILYFF